jgi:MSHA biogenesis protein MshO
VVIVITGVLAAMVAVFIGSPVQGYLDTARRAEMTDAADTALRRLAREVRLALPNSLRVGSSATHSYIEFILTTSGGRYRDAADGSTAGNVLDFANPANKVFDVLGPPINLASGASGDYVVVYNLGEGYEPANAYAAPGPGGNRAQVSSVAGNTITLADNPFAAASPPLPSPSSRFQVVPFSEKAVAYECPKASPGVVTRYRNYGFNASAPTGPPGGSSAIALTNATCDVGYTANVSQRNGLLYIKLTVTDGTAGGEGVTVFQQIHVDNSP